jgi:hypothetical protein
MLCSGGMRDGRKRTGGDGLDDLERDRGYIGVNSCLTYWGLISLSLYQLDPDKNDAESSKMGIISCNCGLRA